MAHPGGPTGGPGHNGGHIGTPGNNDGDAGGLGVGIMSPTGYMSGPRRQQTVHPGLLTPRPAAPTGPAQSPWLMQFLQGMHGMQGMQNLPGQYVPIGGPSPYGVNLPAFQSQMPQAPQMPQPSMAPAGWPNLAALPQIPLGQRPPHNPNALPGGVHGVGPGGLGQTVLPRFPQQGSLLGGGHSFGFPRY